jgi:hypothetical protein
MRYLITFALCMVSLLGFCANPSFNDVAIVAPLPLGAVGDGVTDSTAAIQAAINIAASGAGTNGEVMIPAGVYKITSQIDVPPTPYLTNAPSGIGSGLRISGAGPGKTILDFSSIGNGTAFALTNYGYEFVTFQNLTIKGPGDPASQSVGIALGRTATYTNPVIAHTTLWSGEQNRLYNVGIYGFGYGITATNQHGFEIDHCNISSNFLFEVQCVNSHGTFIKNSFFFGTFGQPCGTAIGFIGAGSALGDNAMIQECQIYYHTNAIRNEELNCLVTDPHFEDCSRYYYSTVESGYATLDWIGGYILEHSANLTWWSTDIGPALIQVPRSTGRTISITGAIFDTVSTSRPVINLVSTSTGLSLTFPNIYNPWNIGRDFQWSYPALADGTNSYNVPMPSYPTPQTVTSDGWMWSPSGTTQGATSPFNGWWGTIFAVGTNDITLTSLGRMTMFGFTNKAHRILVLDPNTYFTNAFVDLPMNNDIGAWKYIPCSIVLPAASTNIMVTDVTQNGDFWNTVIPVGLSTNVVKIWSCFNTTVPRSFTVDNTNRIYANLNFTYRTGSGAMQANAIAGTTRMLLTDQWEYSTNNFPLTPGAINVDWSKDWQFITTNASFNINGFVNPGLFVREVWVAVSNSGASSITVGWPAGVRNFGTNTATSMPIPSTKVGYLPWILNPMGTNLFTPYMQNN